MRTSFLLTTTVTLQREVNAESAEAQRLQDEFDRDQADVERLAQVRQSHLRHHAGHLDELAPRLFQSLDTDGDGKLSEPELRAALSANALSARQRAEHTIAAVGMTVSTVRKNGPPSQSHEG